jgi:hypothetical protein
MSIYRPREPVTQYDHIDCLTQATGATDVDLLNIALTTGRPVMIGLSGASVIAKKVEMGDEQRSYESLIDSCLTVADLRDLQQAGVKDPDKLPPKAFALRVQIIVPETSLYFHMETLGKNHRDATQLFERLFCDNPFFRETFFDTVATEFANSVRDIDLAYREKDVNEIENELPPGITWRVLSEDEVVAQSDDAEKLGRPSR